MTQHFKQKPTKSGDKTFTIPAITVTPYVASFRYIETYLGPLEDDTFIIILRDGVHRDISIPVGEDAQSFATLCFQGGMFVVDPDGDFATELVDQIKTHIRTTSLFLHDIWLGTYAEYNAAVLADDTNDFFRHFSTQVQTYKRIVSQVPPNANAGLGGMSEFEDV